MADINFGTTPVEGEETTTAGGVVLKFLSGAWRVKGLGILFSTEADFASRVAAAAGMPEGAAGDIMYHNGTEWVAGDLTNEQIPATMAEKTFTGKTQVEVLAETAVNMVANQIDLSKGGLFRKTITAASTLTVANAAPAGKLSSFILEITNGGNFAVTWWAGIKWAGGTAPTLTSNGTDTLGFYTADGGVTWKTIGKDIK